MQLYLIIPSNPLVSSVSVSESRWNRYRVWQPLSLMVLAGLTPSEWKIPIVDEKRGVPDYDSRLRPDLVSNLSYRNNSRPDRRTYADFQRQWCPFPGMNRMQLQTQA